MNRRGLARSIFPLAAFAFLAVSLVGSFARAAMKSPLWVKADGDQLATLVPAEKIHAWFGDEQARVQSVHPADGNLVLLIVMDVVGDLTRVDTVRAALSDMLNSFGPREFVGILRAQDGLQVLLEPTTNHEAL